MATSTEGNSMAGKFKALGLALVAVFALSAVAAAGASAAQEHTFRSEKEKTVITAHVHDVANGGSHILTIGSTKIECSTITFVGTSDATTNDQITISAKYEGCKTEPFGEATVKMNHCALIFDSDTTESGDAKTTNAGAGVEHAPVEIECAGTDKIEILVSSCTIRIGSQRNLHDLRYENAKTGTKEEITGTVTANNIAYTKSGFICFLISGEFNYHGKLTLKGYEDTEEVSGTDLTTPASYTHNSTQVDVTVETP